MANTYWVEPGRFLAGEYPGATRVEPAGRIALLLDAGITSFINLTAEGELTPYDADLGRGIVHRRFPITDHGLPSSPATIDEIVTTIEQDLAEGRRIYLHCRAGIGRTGMAVGCYLIQSGLAGPAALDKLHELWRRCSRARSWPTVPETEEQVRFVRDWVAPRLRAVGPAHRIEGAFIGLAVGEALGQLTASHQLTDAGWLTESKRIDKLRTGPDTAMTIAAAESLLTQGRHDQTDQLRRYVEWSQRADAQWQIPGELKRVLAAWQWSRKANPGSHDPANLDAHTLARTLAPAVFAKGDVFKAVELAADVSRATLQSPLVLDAARIWAAVLLTSLSGATKAAVLSLSAAKTVLQGRPANKPQILTLLNGNWTRTAPHDGAISIVATALDVFRVTQTFEAAVREGARTSPSCAALVGSLAGAHYGSTAIPTEWSSALTEAEALSALAHRFGA